MVRLQPGSWAFGLWRPDRVRWVFEHVPIDVEALGGRLLYRPPTVWATPDEIVELLDTPSWLPLPHVVARAWERVLVRIWAGWCAEPWHLVALIGTDRLLALDTLGRVARPWRGREVARG